MLQPKKPKYRNQFKGRMHGYSKGGNSLNFGSYGLKAITPARITSRQIEAARRCISRHLKSSGKVWIRIFPDVPITKKPAEVRQGKGKGSVEFWAAKVKPGKVLLEIDGVAKVLAQEAFDLASAKLPNKNKFTIVNSNRVDLDLFLMTQAKHYVVIPSSFNWWGCWLSDNENKSGT